jgi:prevent-host-death family protein
MGTHSVAEAKNRLSDLIERAARGEEVIITRHGKPVAELRSLPELARPVGRAAVDWLVAHRVGKPGAVGNAGELVSHMRDEDIR